ncbi:MAG: N5-glutamine methyltransferase family protein, partial [Stenotrophobium sp.]
MNIAQALAQASARLAATNESARADAEIMLAQVLGVSRGAFYAKAEDEVPVDCAAKFFEHTSRRALGEPVAYITGEQGFWSLNLRVTPDVLIPRPETELLVEWGLDLLKDLSSARLTRNPSGRKLRISDLGAGSGAIALALATEMPDAQVIATDVSKAALEV